MSDELAKGLRGSLMGAARRGISSMVQRGENFGEGIGARVASHRLRTSSGKAGIRAAYDKGYTSGASTQHLHDSYAARRVVDKRIIRNREDAYHAAGLGQGKIKSSAERAAASDRYRRIDEAGHAAGQVERWKHVDKSLAHGAATGRKWARRTMAAGAGAAAFGATFGAGVAVGSRRRRDQVAKAAPDFSEYVEALKKMADESPEGAVKANLIRADVMRLASMTDVNAADALAKRMVEHGDPLRKGIAQHWLDRARGMLADGAPAATVDPAAQQAAPAEPPPAPAEPNIHPNLQKLRDMLGRHRA